MTTLPRRAFADARLFFRSPIALTVAVLFLAGAATTLAFFPREGVGGTEAAAAAAPALTQDQRSEFERWYLSQPRIPLVVPAEGAKVLIVKFNDFQCPACGQSYLLYKPVLAKYEAEQPGAVKMVLKDYPLNRDCNERISQTLHPAACEAAVAVRLAEAHHKTAELEEWLYTRRHRARQAAQYQGDADLLHQRREGRERDCAAVLRAGDRLRAAARQVRARTVQ
ncbi:MAG: thioredoxin domain-containing protein [Acidobacteria bacterium]|nr:thioredoxin domain-containing protein [Acidobacteriota bacterium]